MTVIAFVPRRRPAFVNQRSRPASVIVLSPALDRARMALAALRAVRTPPPVDARGAGGTFRLQLHRMMTTVELEAAACQELDRLSREAALSLYCQVFPGVCRKAALRDLSRLRRAA